MKLPKIDKQAIHSTDNGGIALTSELEQWFEDVVEVLNYLIEKSKFKDEETRQSIADIILHINHTSKGCGGAPENKDKQ